MLAPVFFFLAAYVFSQGLTLTGAIHTGLAAYLPEGGDTTISLWSPDEGVAARVHIFGSASGIDDLFGVNFEIQSDAPYTPTTSSLFYYSASGWVKFWENRLTVIGGKLDDNGVLRTMGGIDEEDMAKNDFGFHLRIQDLPYNLHLRRLTFGMTVMPGAIGHLNTTNTLGKGNYRFALRYLVPNNLGILAMFYDNAQTDLYPHDRLHAFLAFDILFLRRFGLAQLKGDFAAYDIQDGDYMNVKAGQIAVYQKGNWEFGGRFRQSFLLGSEINVSGYTPELLFRLYGTYSVKDGSIRPRIEAGYLFGGDRGNPVSPPDMMMDGYETLKGHSSIVDPTANETDRLRGFRKDTAYLSIIPQVEFRVNRRSATAVTVGGGPLFDLTAGNEKYNYFLFTNLSVSF